MNSLVLYGRSRRFPVSAGVLAAVALALWAALRGTRAEPDDLPLAVFVLTGNVVAAALGLGGPDLALDRTAAIRWAPRRAGHVLLLGAAATGALLAVQAVGPDLVPIAVALRDGAGLTGLAALGAACLGPVGAWTLPTGWLAVALFVPPPPGRTGQALHWLLQPAGTTTATTTAVLLLTTGTALYAALGPRR